MPVMTSMTTLTMSIGTSCQRCSCYKMLHFLIVAPWRVNFAHMMVEFRRFGPATRAMEICLIRYTCSASPWMFLPPIHHRSDRAAESLREPVVWCMTNLLELGYNERMSSQKQRWCRKKSVCPSSRVDVSCILSTQHPFDN